MSPTLVKLPRIFAKSHRAVTELEYGKIISVVPTNQFAALRDSLLIRMLWDTGMRVSELCDLDLSQINEIQRSAVIQTKKNGKKRIIVWSEETQRILMKYMPIRLEFNKFSNANALFVGYNKGRGWSSRLTSRSVQRIIKYNVDRAGIREKITPHSFRHGWAHKRRDQNAPLAFIQRGLGHLNPVSTFVYEQYDDKEFESNANKYLTINKA
ncbi:MAG: tyrosine-type recombinase/integrase [Bacteroidota bacterium]